MLVESLSHTFPTSSVQQPKCEYPWPFLALPCVCL